ncbi:MAG: hypothetical protein [Malazfec virus 7]
MKKHFFSTTQKQAPLGCSDEAQNVANFDATNAVKDASCARNLEPIIAAPQGRKRSNSCLLPNERSESINTLQALGTAPESPKESKMLRLWNQ